MVGSISDPVLLAPSSASAASRPTTLHPLIRSSTKSPHPSSSPYYSIAVSDVLLKVSSTVDKTSGKKNLLDGSEESCWGSKEGLPQSISLTFPSSSPLPAASHLHLALTFQGGFVGTSCAVYLGLQSPSEQRPGEGGQREGGSAGAGAGAGKKEDLVYAGTLFPKDGNVRQVFEIPRPEPIVGEWIKELKLVFEKSSDPFGRIVVYNLELLEAR